MELRERCVEFLRKNLPENVQKQIRELYEKEGPEWWVPFHFSWGMGIRNMLRDGGFRDDLLPCGDWDHYWVQVVEVAVGIKASTTPH